MRASVLCAERACLYATVHAQWPSHTQASAGQERMTTVGKPSLHDGDVAASIPYALALWSGRSQTNANADERRLLCRRPAASEKNPWSGVAAGQEAQSVSVPRAGTDPGTRFTSTRRVGAVLVYYMLVCGACAALAIAWRVFSEAACCTRSCTGVPSSASARGGVWRPAYAAATWRTSHFHTFCEGGACWRRRRGRGPSSEPQEDRAALTWWHTS